MNKTLRSVVAAGFAGTILLGSGCSTTPPSPPDDKVAITPAPAAPPATAPQAPPAPRVAPIVAAPPIEQQKPDKPAAKAPVKPAVVLPPKPQAATPAPATPTLALDTLEQRLKDTPAIGVFTKLTLKNQVDDLLDRFRAYYGGRGGLTIPQLRQHYEQLLAKVHGLLKDGDPALASAVVNSREAIWGVLTDPAKFAKL
jgi:hypothetical protein